MRFDLSNIFISRSFLGQSLGRMLLSSYEYNTSCTVSSALICGTVYANSISTSESDDVKPG